MKDDLGTDKQSTKRARPMSLPPAWLSAKWIQPRLAVELPRISQSLSPATIRSSHRFFTTRANFADRFNPLRLPARFFTAPFLALPALPALPLTLPALPGLPLALPALPALPLAFQAD